MLKIAFSEIYAHHLPEKHRFPMLKYELLPKQLLHEGVVVKENFFHPKNALEKDILEVHDARYWQRLIQLNLSPSEIRSIGFPLSQLLVEREIHIAGGTLQCITYALAHGISFNIAGGTHHAFSDRGEGFCMLNDQAIGANYLLRKEKAKRVLIVDLDVHQGNGTAEIFKNDPRVFTFSMHGAKNYPIRKEQSDLDIGLEDGCKDEAYLTLLMQHLNKVTQGFYPDFIFYQAGVDVLATDKLGRLGLTKAGCKRRDQCVLEFAHREQIPMVVCMGGGYSPNIKDIIDAHANTFKLAQQIFF
jgi:acetoin utilization deacetylase AcuC-like enzyme